MGASAAGGMIAFYQLGKALPRSVPGLGGRGRGPLALFGFAAIAAVIMGGLSFVSARRHLAPAPTRANARSEREHVRSQQQASRAGGTGFTCRGCEALRMASVRRFTHHRGGAVMALPPNDGGVAKRYGVVLAGRGAGGGIDACARALWGERPGLYRQSIGPRGLR